MSYSHRLIKADGPPNEGHWEKEKGHRLGRRQIATKVKRSLEAAPQMGKLQLHHINTVILASEELAQVLS